MSDAIANAVIAGLLAAAAALAAAAVFVVFAFRHDHYRRAIDRYHEYLSWSRGLIPEGEFILETLERVRPVYDDMVNGGDLRCPTKRLNSDFLAAARLGVIRHPTGCRLFPPLARAYRDVAHTNDMMARFETAYIALGEAGNPASIRGILVPTAQCVPGARGSVVALLETAREQEALESDHPSTFWQLD